VAASWSNLVSLPFLFFIFIFTPKKHHPPSTQRSHTSDPSSTNYHFNYNTLLIARAFGARLVYSLVSARVLCSEPRRSRTCCSRHLEPWQPVSLHTTRFSNFLLLLIFACLLLHVEETGYYIFIKQIIATPKVYAFLKSRIVNLPMARLLPHPHPCEYLLLAIFPIILPHQLAPTVTAPR